MECSELVVAEDIIDWAKDVSEWVEDVSERVKTLVSG